MNMKKLAATALAGLMALSLTACGGSSTETTEAKDQLAKIKEQGYIVLGTSPDYAPNEFIIDDNGEQKIVGTDISLAQAIADKIGVELKIAKSDFNTVITNAQTGSIDVGIAGFAWTKERDEAVAFSNDYSRDSGELSWQGLMVRTEDKDKWPTKEDMKAAGVKVGAQAGSIQYEMALTIAEPSNIVALADTSTVAAQLSTGDLDAFVCSSTQALALTETYTNICLLPMETFNMDPDNYWNRTGAIFCKDPSYQSLIDVVNEVIEECKVKNADGKSQLDIWYEEAKALMPFDLTDKLSETELYGEPAPAAE